MRIKKDTYEYLFNSVERTHFETGGIIGIKEGTCISEAFFDQCGEAQHPCVYAPNVDFLNKQIEKWQEEGIQFAGMFHTHIGNAEGLSNADREYIKIIMQAMPETVAYLYFPVLVLPKKEMMVYKAVKVDGHVLIEEETVCVEGI